MTASRRANWFSRAQECSGPKPPRSASLIYLSERLLLAATLLLVSLFAEAAEPIIQSVASSREAFNPSIGDVVDVSFSLSEAGSVNVSIVDGNGQQIRRLATQQSVAAGRQVFKWDGHDDHGEVSANDAYTLQIKWTDGRKSEVFDPTRLARRAVKLNSPSYSAGAGLFSYTLPSPSRVLLTATCLSPSPTVAYKKTIVAGEPRAGGPVIDVWNGLDDSGKIFMPERPGFLVSIEAYELPAPAICTIGNRNGARQASTTRPSGHEAEVKR